MTKPTHGPEGDEQVQTLKHKFFKRLAARRANDTASVVSSPQGRRFVWWVIHDLCQLDAGSFVPGGIEGQRQTDFREGQRDIAMSIEKELQRLQPDAFRLMRNEASEQSEQDARELAEVESQLENDE